MRFGNALLLACLTIGTPASAQERVELPAPARAGWLATFDVEGRWIQRLPTFASQQALLADGRVIGSGDLRVPTRATLAGVNVGVGCTVNDRWVLPLLGAGFGWAAGPHPRVWAQDHEVPIEMKLWTLRSLWVGLPGAGVRFKHRRWSFQATVQPSLRWYWMDAAAGRDSNVDFIAQSMSFSLSGQLETCRRFDPINRGCLLFAPVIYEGGPGNGGAAAMRWEFGP